MAAQRGCTARPCTRRVQALAQKKTQTLFYAAQRKLLGCVDEQPQWRGALGATTTKRNASVSLAWIDLNPALANMPAGDVVKYQAGNLLESTYPDDHFKLVTSVSVIEHGYDGEKLFREMSRLLPPGGYFVASFDYWRKDRQQRRPSAAIRTQNQIDSRNALGSPIPRRLVAKMWLAAARCVIRWQKGSPSKCEPSVRCVER